MEEIHEKRKFDQNTDQFHTQDKRQATEDVRSSIINRSDEDILTKSMSATVSMSCPPEKVGPLIGRKGVIVQEIMKRSTCRIYVDQNYPEGHPRQIQMTGHPKDLGIAIALVSMVMEHGPSVIVPSTAMTTTTTLPSSSNDSNDQNDNNELLCPASKVGALIGSKGSNVQEINHRTGCRVQVLQERGIAEGADRRVSFFGTPQQIAEAKVLVQQLISGGILDSSSSHVGPGHLSHSNSSGSNNVSSYQQPSPPARYSQQQPHLQQSQYTTTTNQDQSSGGRTLEIDIAPDKVRLVIGARGVTIGEIMKRSGCKIFVNQHFPEGQPHKVVYTGTPQQIDIARYLVDTVVTYGMSALYAVLNGQESVVIQEINLIEAQANRLQNSDVPNELQSRFNVKANISDPELQPTSSNTAVVVRMSIIGKVDQVSTAMKFIYQFLGSAPVDPPSQPVDLLASTNAVAVISNVPPPPPSLNNSQGVHSQGQSRSAYHPHAQHPHHHSAAASSMSGSINNRPSGGAIIMSSTGGVALPHQQQQQPGPILALGKDGTSGHLESAFTLSDGSHQQVAEINNDCMGRIIGARSSTVALIKSKSGANIQVLKADQTKNTTRVILTGLPSNVTLAAQMIQEVLVNGTAKLLKMPDAPSPAPQMKAGPPILMAPPPPHSDGSSDGATINYHYNPQQQQQHAMPPPTHHHTLPPGHHHASAGPQFYASGGIPIYPGVTLSPPASISYC